MEKKVSVVHVITRLILGGAQENTVLSCEGLRRLGRYDVTLVCGPALGPEGSLEERARSAGYRFVLLDSMRREIHALRDAAAFVALWWRFVRTRPHIVHTHSSKAGILGRFAALLAGVPRIVHTVHGLAFHEFQPRSENWLYRGLEWAAGWITDRMVFVGDVMRSKSIRARMTSAARSRVVISGIEVEPYLAAGPDREAVRRELGIPAGRRVVAMIARLAPLKGHQELLEALRRLDRNVHLLLIGDGELRGELERRASADGTADRVTFTGLVQPSRIPDLLRCSDCLVHTSFREGLPRACVQGLLSGLPVVAFDYDGAREVVVDGVTGYLVPRPTPEDLARQLQRVLGDPERAKRMGEEGRRRVRERYDAESMVRGLDSLYREFRF